MGIEIEKLKRVEKRMGLGKIYAILQGAKHSLNLSMERKTS